MLPRKLKKSINLMDKQHKQLSNVDASEFLATSWQKKPQLFRQAIENFAPPLSPDELAGLALEADIESRIIIQDGNQWHLHHGPFDENFFQSLEGKVWTLLVQSVDHWIEEISELKAYFDFLPRWRLDDIMISYAPIGGSVGPHFDQYDVFLLQTSGERLWQIGQHCKDSDEHLASDVKVLADFEESERHLLKAGDMLYLPPSVAHHGVSQSDDCMTISIGFRAPSTLEALDRLVLNLGEQLTSGDRYKDPELPLNHPNQIDEQSLAQLQTLIESAIKQPEIIAKTFGELMTEKRHANESQDLDEVNTYFVKALDARLAFIEQAEEILLFANGQSLSVDNNLSDFVQWVCDCDEVDLSQLNEMERSITEWLVEQGVFIQMEG